MKLDPDGIAFQQACAFARFLSAESFNLKVGQ
jgi:hypothetical protein